MHVFFSAVGPRNQPREFNGQLWPHCCLLASKFRPMKFVLNSRRSKGNCETRLFSPRLLGAASFRPVRLPFTHRSYKKFSRTSTESHDGRTITSLWVRFVSLMGSRSIHLCSISAVWGQRALGRN